MKPFALFILLPMVCFAGWVNNPRSVLLVGNSFTGWGTIYDQLNSIYKSRGDNTFHAEGNWTNSWTLAMHWNDTALRAQIRAGYNGKPWDVVVLQAQSDEPESPSAQPGYFTAVKQLDSLIRAAGSNTYLELTWSYKSITDNSMFNGLISGLQTASASIGNAPIIPAGYAVMALRDSMPLYLAGDDKHLNQSGWYLDACTMYGFFSGQSPVGVTWVYSGATAVPTLQKTAWQTCLDHPYASAKRFALTATATAGGTVSPTSGQYDSGSVVSVSATASPGYTFSSWTGDLSGAANPASLTMLSAKSVTAHFTLAAAATYDTLQAEAGATVLPTKIVSDSACCKGFTGAGYVDFQSTGTEYIQWTYSAAVAGTYSLVTQYAYATSGDRPLEVAVNGVVVDTMHFDGTGSLATWKLNSAAVSVHLNAGSNTIRLSQIGVQGANIDFLRITRPGAITGIKHEAHVCASPIEARCNGREITLIGRTEGLLPENIRLINPAGVVVSQGREVAPQRYRVGTENLSSGVYFVTWSEAHSAKSRMVTITR